MYGSTIFSLPITLSPQKIVKNFVVLNFFFSRLSQKFQSVTAYLMQHEPKKKGARFNAIGTVVGPQAFVES